MGLQELRRCTGLAHLLQYQHGRQSDLELLELDEDGNQSACVCQGAPDCITLM